MIIRWYEMQCDTCGCAEHFRDTKADANRQAREHGWAITPEGKHYDTSECYERSKMPNHIQTPEKSFTTN